MTLDNKRLYQVENTIILEDERDNKTIIIDHNTQSIYVRVTDIDTKRNIVMYGFKDSNHLERLVKQDEYNIEFLTNRASYVNRSNKVAQLDYVATQTSFLISKPILTTKEELSQARINDGNTIECGVQEDDRSNRTTERASSTNRRKTWNLVIYKQNSQMSTSSEIDAVKSTFRSLSSTEGSNWYYSTIMYAELNIRYEQAPSTFHNTNSNQCLTDFTFHLLTLGVPHNRYDHSYVYLKEEKWDDAAGRAANVSYRIAVSRNSRGTLAHEVGHTLGAVHNSSTFWDSSLGWFGWWGSSIMCEAYPWWSGMQYKYYSASNRGIVKGTLN